MRQHFHCLWLIAFLARFGIIYATDESPWIDTILVPFVDVKATYQNFNQVKTGSHKKSYLGRDTLIEAGLYFAPTSELSFELEASLLKAHKHGFNWNEFRETARFVILDEASGDWSTAALGMTCSEPMSPALNILDFIHHAHFESEMFLSIGWEYAPGQLWQRRVWALLGMGLGSSGSPWAHGKLACELCLCERHVVQVQLNTEVGFGGNNLNIHQFRSYGPVSYRFLDASCKYSYQTEDAAVFSIEFAGRILSENVPYAAQRVALSLTYPFNL